MKAYCSSFLFVCLLSIVLLPVASQADTIFFDSFESADKSATNADGFKWSQVGRIVTMDPRPVVVWRSGQSVYEPGPAGSDWSAQDGQHSLHFQYKGYHSSSSDDAKRWSEQRFNLGTPQRELWVRFWLRVPTNYTHEYVAVGTSNNRKLFSIWMDDYSSKGNGPTVIWQFRRDNSFLKDGKSSYVEVSYSSGGYKVVGGAQQLTPFISVPDDRGRWMQLVFRVKASTSSSSRDGEIQMWRRWDNESEFTHIHNLTGVDLPVCTTCPNGWRAGYLLGYHNEYYPEDTDWLIDGFTLSNTKLLDYTSTAPVGPSNLRINR